MSHDGPFRPITGHSTSYSPDHLSNVESNHIPPKPEGGFRHRIFRFLGIRGSRKHPTPTPKDISSTTHTEKRRKSRILGLRGDERLQHVSERKIRQPLEIGDAGSISFSNTSGQNSERMGVSGDTGHLASAVDAVGDTTQADSTIVDQEDLVQFDSATTSNTSTHSPLETALSNKPPSTLSQNTAATSFSHTTRPISVTPILLPPHSPASPTAPSTSSLRPRLTDDASVLTLASSSKRIRRRNSFDTNASMLAIAPSSRRESQESLPEFDGSEASISGARRSVGSVLSSKHEGGGRARSVATGQSVGMGEEHEEDDDSEQFTREFETNGRDVCA